MLNLGWGSRRWLHANSGRVWGRPLHSWRFHGIHEWNEVHDQVRAKEAKHRNRNWSFHSCPGTENMTSPRNTTVPITTPAVGGTRPAPGPTWLGSLQQRGKKLIKTSKYSFITVEIEETTHWKAGRRSRWCWFPNKVCLKRITKLSTHSIPMRLNMWSYRGIHQILESYRWARIDKFLRQKCRIYKFSQQKCRIYTFWRQKCRIYNFLR